MTFVQGVTRVGPGGDGTVRSSRTKTVALFLPHSHPGIPRRSEQDFKARVCASPFPDTFEFAIRQKGPREFFLCVTRTDAPHGWGQDLHVYWTIGDASQAVSTPFAGLEGIAVIGPSSTNDKVSLHRLRNDQPDLPPNLTVSVLAVSSNFPDDFSFNVHAPSTRVLRIHAKRLDATHGWGQHLRVFWRVELGATNSSAPAFPATRYSDILAECCVVRSESMRQSRLAPSKADLAERAPPDIRTVVQAWQDVLCPRAVDSTSGFWGSLGGLFGGPGVGLNDQERRHVASVIEEFHKRFPQRQQALVRGALWGLVQSEKHEGHSLSLYLGLLEGGVRECAARREWVLHAVVASLAGGRVEGAPGEFEEALQSIETARTLVQRVFEEIVEEQKDTAFVSCFLEPSKLFFRMTHDRIMEGDVDVHGANIFLRAVEVSIDVRHSRQGIEENTIKGVAACLSAFGEEVIADFVSPSHLGKAWETVRRGRPLPPIRAPIRMCRNTLWSGMGCGSTSADVCAMLTAPAYGSVAADLRQHWAAWVRLYLSAFGADRLLPLALNRMMGNGNRGMDLTPVLQYLFVEMMKNEGEGGGEGGSEAIEDVRFWLWDEAHGYSLSLSRAQQLFSFAGCCRE
uniref:Uncharacterized protein n=1 Tax=Chromera velia CCMP2878 TaxID=1169474 RepID=A0A0G4ICK5_9ALVE|eukprot:Cvel_13151.t1-p1 / transcript=Cvel_13151.t1 / gene=Cvel_13151 / organism=Chromera_velia_CCMP2878 / gene_product=hypothetical protein / transcript_product=hypothetical protein / location=Cvel_scaffold887:55208-57082(-) / protein_length=625 / sequence_SO=supercontig / SO=protein_coding / is_pseudo=false